MFVPDKPFHPSLKLASKARAYPSGVPVKCSTLGKAPGLTHKHYTRMERPERDSRLLQTFINYICGIFITLDTVTLPSNIRQGLNFNAATNALAYYANVAVEKFNRTSLGSHQTAGAS